MTENRMQQIDAIAPPMPHPGPSAGPECCRTERQLASALQSNRDFEFSRWKTMSRLDDSSRIEWKTRMSRAASAIAFAAVAALAMCFARPAAAQVEVSGWQGGFSVSAGGAASYYFLGYGQRRMTSATAFFDADTRTRFGVEGEARWLLTPQVADVHATTWLAGPRYSIHPLGKRFFPYAKGLVGVGQFTFPYNYAKGDYLVIAPGGGIDYRLTHRIRIRLFDAEYQFWPQFTYGSLTSYGVSVGAKVRLF